MQHAVTIQDRCKEIMPMSNDDTFDHMIEERGRRHDRIISVIIEGLQEYVDASHDLLFVTGHANTSHELCPEAYSP